MKLKKKKKQNEKRGNRSNVPYGDENQRKKLRWSTQNLKKKDGMDDEAKKKKTVLPHA